jgi:hypothetical protein
VGAKKVATDKRSAALKKSPAPKAPGKKTVAKKAVARKVTALGETPVQGSSATNGVLGKPADA